MARKVVALGRKMIDIAEKMVGGDDAMFNNLLRVGNDMVRIGTLFERKSLRDFPPEDLKFIRDFALKHKSDLHIFS